MNLRTFNIKEFLYYGVPVALVDMVIYLAVFHFLSASFPYAEPEDVILMDPRCLFFLVLGFLMARAFFPSRIYERGFSWKRQLITVFLQALLTITVLALSVDVLYYSFAGFFFLYQGILTVLLSAIWHMLFRWAILIARRKGRNKVHVVIVGQNDLSRRLQEVFANMADYADYKLVASFADDLPAIEAYLSQNKVHQLYCCLSSVVQTETVNSLIRSCENLFIEFYYVPHMEGYLRHSVSYGELGSVPVFKLREEPLSNPLNSAFKRAVDIVLSLLVLLLVFPLVYVFVAVGTLLSSPGPIFFKQKRTGYKGRPFVMYKFRSMRPNAEADQLQATAQDPRKTKFGDFLRRTSLDELPQFINVLRGEMSVIGPRPHMELHTEMYTKLVDEYLVRHMVKPGITGWAQVNGYRGETPSTDLMAQRVRYDIWYIEHWSPTLDIKIFFRTIAQILKGDEKAY